MKKIVILLFLYAGIVSGQTSQSIKISPEATFSVITCGAGNELYSSFGHSAFRFKDPVYGYDVVYNYGTFDFDTPLFYVKFARGKLPYQLGRSSFKRFVAVYKYEKRWIKEQVLRLTPDQTEQLLAFLETNYEPENRDYKYDFFFNNCATKIRDVIRENFDNQFIFHQDHLPEKKTFRDLIHDNLDSNSWSSFGIDIALGAVIDKPVHPDEFQFLPEYVFKAFENATLVDGVTPLVSETELILAAPENAHVKGYFFLSPYFIFSIIALLVFSVTYLDFKKGRRSRWLDTILLTVTGIAGIVIFLLWYATDHSATATNMNIWWLFPLTIYWAYQLSTKKQEKRKLWIIPAILLFLLLLVLCIWIIDFQQFALAAIPLLLVLIVRYVYLLYYFRKLAS